MSEVRELPKIKLPKQVKAARELPSLRLLPNPNQHYEEILARNQWNRQREAQQKAWEAEREAERLADKAAYDAYVAERQAQQDQLTQYMMDYNDSTVENSFGDVFWNVAEDVIQAAKDVIDKPDVFTIARLYDTYKTAPKDYAKRSLSLSKNQIIDPAWQALTGPKEYRLNNWGTVGMNALMNFGETADIFANPVKSQLMNWNKSSEYRKQMFLNSIGWGIEGRQNFDYDFSGMDVPQLFGYSPFKKERTAGTFAYEMAAEVASDPMTWLTWGMSGLAKVTARRVLKGLVEELPDAAAKQASKVLVREVMSGKHIDDASIKVVEVIREGLLRQLKAGGIDTDAVLRRYGGEAMAALTPATVRRAIAENNAYRVAMALNKTAAGVDKTIMKVAWNTSTLGMATAIHNINKYAGGAAWNAVVRRAFKRSFEPHYIPGTDIVKVTELAPATNEYAKDVKFMMWMRKMDDSLTPASVADLQIRRSVTNEINTIQALLNKHKDVADMKAALDEYVNRVYPELNRMYQDANGNFLEGFPAYRKYISELTSKVPITSNVRPLGQMLDIAMLKYEISVDDAATALRKSEQIPQAKNILGRIEDVAERAGYKQKRLGLEDIKGDARARRKDRLNVIAKNNKEISDVSKQINNLERVIARLDRRIDELMEMLDSADYADYERLLAKGNDMTDLEFDRFAQLEDRFANIERQLETATNEAVNLERKMKGLKQKLNTAKTSRTDALKTFNDEKINIGHADRIETIENLEVKELWDVIFDVRVMLRDAHADSEVKDVLDDIARMLNSLDMEQMAGKKVNTKPVTQRLFANTVDGEGLAPKVSSWIADMEKIPDEAVSTKYIKDLQSMVHDFDMKAIESLLDVEIATRKYTGMEQWITAESQEGMIDFIPKLYDALNVIETMPVYRDNGILNSPAMQKVRYAAEHIQVLLDVAENERDYNAIIEAVLELDTELNLLVNSLRSFKGARPQHLHGIEEIQREFSDLMSVAYFNPMLSTKEGLRHYTMQGTKIKSLVSLLNAPGVPEMLNASAFGTKTSIVPVLESILLDSNAKIETIHAIKHVLEKTEGMKHFVDMVQTFKSSGFDDQTVVSLVDTLQRQTNVSVDQFNNEFDSRFYAWLRAAEEYRNSIELDESFSMDKIRDRLGMNSKDAHDARQDVLDLIEIAERELDMDDYIKSNHVPIWYDIETTGLGTHADQIYQIAYKLPGEDVLDLRIRVDEYPSEDALAKLAPAADELLERYPNMDVRTARMSWFYDEFMDPNNPNLITEKRALERFKEVVKTQTQGKQKPLMIGHNIKRFDQNMLRDRMAKYELGRMPFADVVDTLQELRAKAGYTEIDAKETKRIRAILKTYLDMRTESGRFRGQLQSWRAMDGVSEAVTKPQRQMLIETFDKEFIADMDVISREMSQAGSMGGIDMVVDRQHMIDWRNMRQGITGELSNIKAYNNHYHSYFLEMGDYMDGWHRALPEEVQWNLTRQFGLDPLREGKFMGMGYKSIGDVDLMRAYYDIPEDQMASHLMERYNKSARRIRKLAGRVDLLEPIRNNRDGFINYIREVQRRYKNSFNLYAGTTDPKVLSGFIEAVRDPVYGIDVDRLKDAEIFAVALRYFQDGQSLREKGLSMLNSMYAITSGKEVRELLERPNLLKFNNQQNRIDDFLSERLLTDSTADRGSKFFNEYEDLVDQYDSVFDRMHAIEKAREKFDIYNAEARTVMGIMEPTYKVFKKMRDTLNAVADEYGKGSTQYNDAYKKILNETGEYSDMLGREQLYNFISKDPHEMLSYLWYDAYGVVSFNYDDLASGKSAGKVGPASKAADAFDAIMHDTDEYNDIGIEFFQEGDTDRVWVVLDKNKVPKDVQYFGDKYDVKVTRKSGTALGSYLKDLYEALDGLKFYSNGASKNTAGEKFTRQTYDTILESVPDGLKKYMFTSQELASRSLFDGPRYNKSVLGTVDSKKELIPFISHNPFKNFSLSAQELASQKSNVTRYTGVVLNEGTKLDGPLLKGFTNQQLLEYFKAHPEYKIADVVQHDRTGFKMVERKISTLADVAYARSEGLSILPEHIINKSKSIINAARISNEMMRLLEKYYAGPLKLGYLSAFGFLARNTIDSTMKNAAVADTLEIIPYTLQVWGQYMKYRTAVKEILGKHGDLTSTTIADYFEGDPVIDKDLFVLMHNFIKDGPSAGHTQTLQKFFDNDVNMLYRRRGDFPITKDDIKRALNEPEEVTRNKHTPEVAERLLFLKSERDLLRKAVHMSQRAKTNELDVERIMTYLKRPWEVPPQLTDEFDRLKKHTDKWDLAYRTEDHIDKMLYGRGTQVIMNANSHLEQVFRLTQFLYQYNTGATVDEAISKVIKANFDPIHKSKFERNLDLLFPFATFTTQNLLLWSELMNSNGSVGRLFRDVMTPAWNFDEHEKEDLFFNRSLQWQILAGNIPIQEITKHIPFVDKDGNEKLHYDGTRRYQDVDIATTFKLSPSIMDTMNLLMSPIETIQGRLLAPVRLGIDALRGEEVDLMQLIPFYNVLQRQASGTKYYADTGNVVNRLLPSLFGRTNLRRHMPDAYRGDPRFDSQGRYIGPRREFHTQIKVWPSNNGFGYNRNYYRRTYPQVTWRNGQARITRDLRNLWYRKRDFHRDIFTKTGKHRIMMDKYGTNPDSVAHKTRAMWRHL